MSQAVNKPTLANQKGPTAKTFNKHVDGDAQDNNDSSQAQDDEDEAKLIEALRQLDDMHNKVSSALFVFVS